MPEQSEMPEQPLIINIREYGARPHQMGRGPGNDASRGSGVRIMHEGEENPSGPVVVHVRDGKPLTAFGRKVLGLP